MTTKIITTLAEALKSAMRHHYVLDGNISRARRAPGEFKPATPIAPHIMQELIDGEHVIPLPEDGQQDKRRSVYYFTAPMSALEREHAERLRGKIWVDMIKERPNNYTNARRLLSCLLFRPAFQAEAYLKANPWI